MSVHHAIGTLYTPSAVTVAATRAAFGTPLFFMCSAVIVAAYFARARAGLERASRPGGSSRSA